MEAVEKVDDTFSVASFFNMCKCFYLYRREIKNLTKNTLRGYSNNEVIVVSKHELPIKLEQTAIVLKNQEEKEKIVNRLKRIEGQVRGIQKMIEDDRYCVDILVQLSAANAALKKVGFTLLEQHTKGCVASAVRSGDGEDAIEELMKVIHQFSKS